MIRVTKGIALISGSLLLLSCVCGCTGTQKKDKLAGVQPSLEPQALPRFTDLPVPAGFKAVPEQSYAFEATGMRVGLLKYQGKATPDQVVTLRQRNPHIRILTSINAVENDDGPAPSAL